MSFTRGIGDRQGCRLVLSLYMPCEHPCFTALTAQVHSVRRTISHVMISLVKLCSTEMWSNEPSHRTQKEKHSCEMQFNCPTITCIVITTHSNSNKIITLLINVYNVAILFLLGVQRLGSLFLVNGCQYPAGVHDLDNVDELLEEANDTAHGKDDPPCSYQSHPIHQSLEVPFQPHTHTPNLPLIGPWKNLKTYRATKKSSLPAHIMKSTTYCSHS